MLLSLEQKVHFPDALIHSFGRTVFYLHYPMKKKKFKMQIEFKRKYMLW